MARIDSMLKAARAQGSSDLHLAAGAPPRVRVGGELDLLSGGQALTAAELDAAIAELLTPAERQELAEKRDVETAYGIPGVARFRASFFVTAQGPAAVFRLIPEKVLGLETLALPPAFEPLLSRKSGFVLIATPHGGGRSTLCASCVDRIVAASGRLVVALEDPIESLFPRKQGVVLQREIGRDAPGFADGIRAALRMDTDVVVAGDLPDVETTRLALRAAEGGRLVIAAVPVPGAVRALERLVDGVPVDSQSELFALLADNLAGVLSQVLARRADGHGRVAAHELLLSGPDVVAALRDGELRELTAAMEAGRSAGMTLLDDSLEKLLKAGVITREEAALKCLDRSRFAA